MTEEEGVFGGVFYHDSYEMPPIDSYHQVTPIVDASYAFFKEADLGIVVPYVQGFLKATPNPPVLKIPMREMANLEKLFGMYQLARADTGEEPSNIPSNMKHLFKRCTLFPVYTKEPFSTAGVTDPTEEIRKKTTQLTEVINAGDHPSLLDFSAELERDPGLMKAFRDRDMTHPRAKELIGKLKELFGKLEG